MLRQIVLRIEAQDLRAPLIEGSLARIGSADTTEDTERSQERVLVLGPLSEAHELLVGLNRQGGRP